MKWQNVVNFIAGLWLIVSGFMGLSASFNKWNYVIVGIIVGGLALWMLSEKEKRV